MKLFQDTNNDGRMNSIFGVPLEPYGVSLNASGFPSFKKTKFRLNRNKTINIKLKKAMRKLLCVAFLVLCLSEANAVGVGATSEVRASDSLVAKSLSKLSGQVGIDMFYKVRGEMARINDMCPGSWISPYYEAWLGIQTTLSRTDKDGSDGRVVEAD